MGERHKMGGATGERMKPNHMIIEKIREIASDETVSVLATGPASGTANDPTGCRPEDFMPEAQLFPTSNAQ